MAVPFLETKDQMRAWLIRTLAQHDVDLKRLNVGTKRQEYNPLGAYEGVPECVSSMSSSSSVAATNSNTASVGSELSCSGQCLFRWNGSIWDKTFDGCSITCDCETPGGSGTYVGQYQYVECA